MSLHLTLELRIENSYLQNPQSAIGNPQSVIRLRLASADTVRPQGPSDNPQSAIRNRQSAIKKSPPVETGRPLTIACHMKKNLFLCLLFTSNPLISRSN